VIFETVNFQWCFEKYPTMNTLDIHPCLEFVRKCSFYYISQCIIENWRLQKSQLIAEGRKLPLSNSASKLGRETVSDRRWGSGRLHLRGSNLFGMDNTGFGRRVLVQLYLEFGTDNSGFRRRVYLDWTAAAALCGKCRILMVSDGQ